MPFINKVCICLLQFYRIFLSSWIGGGCRFYPSCSQYSLEAFQKHSAHIAFYLTLRRLLRCRPGGSFGIDLVPESTCPCGGGHPLEEKNESK